MSAGDDRPLIGLRVIDFGQYFAGPLVATLLADQGAEVIRIDPPEGPRLDAPINAFLFRNRQCLRLDLKQPADRSRAMELVAGADVVVENFRPGVMDRLGLGADDCLRRNPGLIYASLPGFPRDDPRAHLAAWEGVLMAAGGAYWRMGGNQSHKTLFAKATDGRPVFSALPLASVFAAGLAATGIAAALLARARDGAGQVVTVPLADAMFEANVMASTSLEIPNPPTLVRAFGMGVYQCADGRAVCLITSQFGHLLNLVHAAGVSSWIDEGLVDYARLLGDREAMKELLRRLGTLFATRPALEWEALLQPAGVALGAVRSVAEWFSHPAFAASGTLVDQADPTLGVVRVPGPAVRFSQAGPKARPAPSPDPSLPARPPLSGLRVLDMTRVLAAPTATRLLADLGADVLKIEVDPATLRPVTPEPILHLIANRGKLGEIVDLKSPAGQARFNGLVCNVDLLVTNFRTEAAASLGLSRLVLSERAPGLVVAYLNAYGTEGPWAQYRGYAEVLNAVSGVADTTSDWNHLPTGSMPGNDPPWPYTDSMGGILCAFGAVLALYDRARTGRVRQVETSLGAATALELIPDSIAYPGKDWSATPRKGSLGWSPRQRLYQTGDGWIFLAATEADLPELSRRLELGGEATAAALEARFAELATDAAVEAATFGSTAAHAVLSPEEGVAQGHPMDRRGGVVRTGSPENGLVVRPAPVIRFSRTGLAPTPLPQPFGTDARADIDRVFGPAASGTPPA